MSIDNPPSDSNILPFIHCQNCGCARQKRIRKGALKRTKWSNCWQLGHNKRCCVEQPASRVSVGPLILVWVRLTMDPRQHYYAPLMSVRSVLPQTRAKLATSNRNKKTRKPGSKQSITILGEHSQGKLTSYQPSSASRVLSHPVQGTTSLASGKATSLTACAGPVPGRLPGGPSSTPRTRHP
jgi:hypothetical protein